MTLGAVAVGGLVKGFTDGARVTRVRGEAGVSAQAHDAGVGVAAVAVQLTAPRRSRYN